MRPVGVIVQVAVSTGPIVEVVQEEPGTQDEPGPHCEVYVLLTPPETPYLRVSDQKHKIKTRDAHMLIRRCHHHSRRWLSGSRSLQ